MRPERLAVADLIEKELRSGLELLSNIHDGYLLVGEEAVKSFQLNEGHTIDIILTPGMELAIEGVVDFMAPDHKVVRLNDGGRSVYMFPRMLARTLCQGGVIFTPQLDP